MTNVSVNTAIFNIKKVFMVKITFYFSYYFKCSYKPYLQIIKHLAILELYID